MNLKPAFRYLFFMACLCLWAGNGCRAAAASFPAKPDNKSYITDEANIINPAERLTSNELASRLLAEEKIPLFVVVIPSLIAKDAAGHTIERYAAELFNAWGIGSPQRNYGILLLVSPGDRKARIELGSAWGYDHDRAATQVMNTLIVPEFKKGDYSRGILAGVRGLDALARGLALPKPKQPWWSLPALIGIALLLAFMVFNLFKTGHSGWAWALIAGIGVALFMLLRSAANSGGSSGGFGGGSSGGGGATGSW